MVSIDAGINISGDLCLPSCNNSPATDGSTNKPPGGDNSNSPPPDGSNNKPPGGDNNSPPADGSDNNKPGGQQNTGQPDRNQAPPTPTKQAFQSPSSLLPPSLSPTPTNSQEQKLFFASPSSNPTDTPTLLNGTIPSSGPYTDNAMPTDGTNNNTINDNGSLYGFSENAPAAKFIPVIGALFCAAIAGFLLLLFRKRLFKRRAFSRRPIFSVKSFTRSSGGQSSTNHRLHDLDDWSVGPCDKDAQKVTIPPVAQMSQTSYKRASTIDLASSPIRGDTERSLTPEMTYNNQQQSLNPFGDEEGEFEVLVMPSTPERKVNWEDCMR